ncbi:hypothetical protein [Marinagarivorans algicola]|uniref:hypothetical protein n=1 Tax=Marinagarivorans algicola TaxID=1513270 RepID=UPI000A3F72BA|nr:hypothetical protein [Marinagarivorans algicola]
MITLAHILQFLRRCSSFFSPISDSSRAINRLSLKYFSVASAVVALLLLSGCSGSDTTPTNNSPITTSSTLTISSPVTVSSVVSSTPASSTITSKRPSSRSSSSASSTPQMVEDQCNSTSQCRVIYGSAATNCKNSAAPTSVCLCGTTRCDALNMRSSDSSSSSSAQTSSKAPTETQTLRPGDPGVTFDMSKMDPRFPQMQKWITAGARGGIPFIDSHTIKKTLNGGDSDAINKAINDVARDGGGAVLLKNGMYRIDKTVTMKSKVVLIGESRRGVNAIINMQKGNAFYFGSGVRHSGIYRMTIEGGWGRPQYDWNIGTNANFEEPDVENVSVMFKNATDSWLDGVDLLNSGDFPLRCNAKHITLRDLNVDGVHNKNGGAHGYFFILNGYNLITQSKITRLRHISLQGDDVEYNVLYDNDLRQEVSYHSGDYGNNLIENNRITLPADMPNGSNGPGYRAIMGPWSTKHHKSLNNNFNYDNWIHEENRGKPPGVWMSDNDKVYAGPIYDKAVGEQQLDNNFPPMKDNNGDFIVPKSKTLYPIILTPQ